MAYIGSIDIDSGDFLEARLLRGLYGHSKSDETHRVPMWLACVLWELYGKVPRDFLHMLRTSLTCGLPKVTHFKHIVDQHCELDSGKDLDWGDPILKWVSRRIREDSQSYDEEFKPCKYYS